ncbi:MerR family transcriptional regulator [Brevibacillus laterosporus]
MYSISQVAEMVGIPTVTLRAWEKGTDLTMFLM